MSEHDAKVPAGFCPLPWMHMSANTDTSLRVCCNTDHGGRIRNEVGEAVHLAQVSSAFEAMNQKTHKDLRAAMLRGERPDFCKRCYREEDHGGVSVRQIYVHHHGRVLKEALSNTRPDGEIDPKVSYVDFSLSNNCNLKCRMCSPEASYSLLGEFKQLGLSYATEQVEMARTGWDFEGNLGRIAREIVPHLTEMLTTGGEPFMSSQHIKMLELCVESGRAKHIVLRYHSNLTLMPERLIELWQNFKHIELHVSLEGVGRVNEYVRYPAKWEKINEHLERMSRLRDRVMINAEVHTCLQAVSWTKTAELMEWVHRKSNDLGGFFPRIPFPIWVDQPYPMTLESLPPPLRELGSERILRLLDRIEPEFSDGRNPHFETSAALSFRAAIERLRELPYKEQDFQAFLKRAAQFDEIRKQSLLEIVPEFQTVSVS